MIRKRDPREQVLISRFDSLLCSSAINILKNGWEGVFRVVILDLLPIRKVEEKFSPATGRPTKELYSVTGLLLIMEFFGWSMDEAVKQYMTSLSVLFRTVQCRQQHSRQNGNNGDNDQELYERKTVFPLKR